MCIRDSNDIDGYGTTTDYFLAGTEPTTQCNMHRAVTLCSQSHMLPGPNCYATEIYGIVYAPEGHPLRMAESASTCLLYTSCPWMVTKATCPAACATP